MNMTLRGNRVFINVIKMKSYWVRVALNPIGVLIRRPCEDTNTREDITCRQRQRLEQYMYKSRNTKGLLATTRS